jgi:hypothetical protein
MLLAKTPHRWKAATRVQSNQQVALLPLPVSLDVDFVS